MQNKELRIGIIGVGAIGRTHIERINGKLQGAKVVACSDINIEFGKSVAEKYGCRFFEDGEVMIASDDVDALIVTTIDDYHEQYVMAAIKAGKHVFCEKPLAPKAEGCKRIVEAEIAGGKQLVQVGFMRRYDPGYRQLKDAIENRTYGEPLMLHCAHRNPAVDESYTTPMAVENSMIHEIDVIRWLINEEYTSAEVVFAKNTRRTHKDLMDPQIMILTTESGVRIDVEAFVNTGHCYDIKCEVCCEDAILNLPEPANIGVCANAFRGHAIHSDWSTRFVEAYNVEIQEWINATKEGRVDGPTAWDGYIGQVTAAAASKARDTQTKIEIKSEKKPDFYIKKEKDS